MTDFSLLGISNRAKLCFTLNMAHRRSRATRISSLLAALLLLVANPCIFEQLCVGVARRVMHVEPPHHLSFHSLDEHHIFPSSEYRYLPSSESSYSPSSDNLRYHLIEYAGEHQEHLQHDGATAAIQKGQRELLSQRDASLTITQSYLNQDFTGSDRSSGVSLSTGPPISHGSILFSNIVHHTLSQLTSSILLPLGPPAYSL